MTPNNGSSRLDRVEQKLVGVVGHLADHIGRAGETLARVAEEQLRLSEGQTRLAEAQRHAEERLNALLAVVDHLVPRWWPPPA